MAVEFVQQRPETSRPIYLVHPSTLSGVNLPPEARSWLAEHDFRGEAGQFLVLPDQSGKIAGAIFGLKPDDDRFFLANLLKHLPAGTWHFVSNRDLDLLSYLALAMQDYHFDRYVVKLNDRAVRIVIPSDIDAIELARYHAAVKHTRDLINTPSNEMTPEHLEHCVIKLAQRYGAVVKTVRGRELVDNFPLIDVVGRAGSSAPRLIELTWGESDAPKLTLVGKGVSFDSGGLDLKSASNMLLMKKDMGGAANTIGLAQLIMDAQLPVRLRLIIPAVENVIAANAFRPGDIVVSRAGLSVEIGNTDAEGRLILADALSLADEDHPQLLIDMATLTGAARVALGPDLPVFFTQDNHLAEKLMETGAEQCDPMWRLPLWQPYAKGLEAQIADLNNVTPDGFAGSITAALFLQRFVQNAKHWVHFDIYGWTPYEKPAFPKGGEAQCIRALYCLIKARFQ